MRTRALVIIHTLTAAACVGGPSDVAERPSAVEASARGKYYDVAAAPTGALGAAQRATGTVFTPLTDFNKVPLVVNGTPLRVTCGVTFVSPKFAISAAHCFEAPYTYRTDDIPVTVQMYRLGGVDKNGLETMIAQASKLFGLFPAYKHDDMDKVGKPGRYTANTDRYQCYVRASCGSGTRFCPSNITLGTDIGLIECPDAPGNKYGFVDVAATDDLAAVPVMSWSHEIYDIEKAQHVTDATAHYTTLNGRPDNYHYFGKGSNGIESNQLLPLVSIPWPDGTPRKKIPPNPMFPGTVWTDLQGCHGTSGSAVLQKKQNGGYELLGPAVSAIIESNELCMKPDARKPGETGIAYTANDASLAMLQHPPVAADLGNASSSHGPMMWFDWNLAHLRLEPGILRDRPWPPVTCLSCPTIDRLRPWYEPLIAVEPGARLALPAGTFQPGASYRVSVQPALLGERDARVSLWLGSQLLVEGAAARADRPITVSFMAEGEGALPLTISVESEEAVGFHEIVAARESEANGFDDLWSRAGVGVVSGEREEIEPAAFSGNDERGLAALLPAGGRLVFTRLALPAGVEELAVEFSVSGEARELVCGAILASGEEIAAECPVVEGRAAAALRLPVEDQAIAVFIEARAGEDAGIDDLVVAARGR